MIKKIIPIILIFIFINSNGFGQKRISYFPDSVWLKYDSTEEVGYDSKKLDKVKQFIIDSLNTTGLLVLVNGKILFDYGDIEELSYIASCRKSLLSMIFGKYVENGTIDLDKTLEELKIDDIHGLLPIERQATIRDIITARSGIYHPRSNGGDNTEQAPPRGSVEPGSYFLYNNWDFNAAGGIFEQLTKKDIYEAFEKDLVIPLQMQDFKIECQHKSGDTTKSKYLAYHFWLSTRDMARLGLLMLNNGIWKGKQIIPENWVKLTTSLVTPKAQMNPPVYRELDRGFGYMWWIIDSEDEIFKGAYCAKGNYGQYLLIIPKLNMVVSHKTKSDYERNTDYSDFISLIHKFIDTKM